MAALRALSSCISPCRSCRGSPSLEAPELVQTVILSTTDPSSPPVCNLGPFQPFAARRPEAFREGRLTGLLLGPAGWQANSLACSVPVTRGPLECHAPDVSPCVGAPCFMEGELWAQPRQPRRGSLREKVGQGQGCSQQHVCKNRDWKPTASGAASWTHLGTTSGRGWFCFLIKTQMKRAGGRET